MITKPTLPKGTRDYSPEVMLKRNYILDNIRDIFKKYGYLPLETPAMENLSVLQGKYGEEGDRLLFKILNSGDFLKKSTEDDRQESLKLVSKIADKGLRYDLTVPFARYVAANRHDLALPFKRYQIQPVWRADRPQKGRYREFYQCDADVIGTESIICEAEIILIINEVFDRLNISEYEIKVNHRSILVGLCEYLEAPGKLQDLSIAIDKLDKIGWEGVSKELSTRGFTESNISRLHSIINGSVEFDEISNILKGTTADKGINDFRTMNSILHSFKLNNDHVRFDLSLARGLAYYTGMIYEVIIKDSGVGSVSGGGRYDDLTGVFGVSGMPGVGFSFGVDRLYDAMEHLSLFPDQPAVSTQVLITHFDQPSLDYGLGILNQLRNNGVSSEIYPDLTKMRKQLNYADKKNISFVLIIGQDEMETGNITLKNMTTGEEKGMGISEIIRTLNSVDG